MKHHYTDRQDRFALWMKENNRRIMAEVRHLVCGNYCPAFVSYLELKQLLNARNRHIPIFMVVARVAGDLAPHQARAVYESLDRNQKSSLDNGIKDAIRVAEES